jgi:hypothetical protein
MSSSWPRVPHLHVEGTIMSSIAEVRPRSTPLAGGAPGLVRWICTKNPFYVLSAGLFLAGLFVSFGDPAQIINTWAIMSGLAGYTLLLAVTACLLVRFGNVWDDVRTVLLLVVLMFLATSVTFDEVLVLSPLRGFICYLVGLAFACVVSEGVLRGIRVRLPAWYRAPYYSLLGLFFLYPLALSPLRNEPHSEVLMWGLFAFATVAGLAFLTLLPAIRLGPAHVHDNGSPWPWPLYPWSLFVFLAVAVPGRAWLLCWSMQLLDGAAQDQSIFGLYFLVPFGRTCWRCVNSVHHNRGPCCSPRLCNWLLDYGTARVGDIFWAWEEPSSPSRYCFPR